ncbi:MAG TPA: hypothetical protein VIF62_18815 [Labilithrix sp.]|jgi:hypothetical protein
MSQALAYVPPTPVPQSPFSLAPSRDDTALFVDARASFSHLLPGRPVLGLVRPDEVADAMVHLQDAPISLRYHLAPPTFLASSAEEVAWRTAEQLAAWRAGAPVQVELANPTWFASWSVECAAVASYANGSAREELFVLVKQGLVMSVSWTYPAGFVDDPAYATFASVAEATMVWDAARVEQRGRVWPESTFLGPGLYGAPRPKHNEAARFLAAAPIAQEERTHVLGILSGVVSGAGAPWVVLSREMLEANRRAILGATRDPSIHAFVERALPDVKTAHDLRGLAILLARALDGTLH